MTARIHMPGKANKYHAKQTEYKGKKYPSKAQAERAAQLDLMLRAGDIVWFLEECKVELGSRKLTLRVDFIVAEWRNRDKGSATIHAEDVKGMSTQAFKIKVNLWREFGPFPLHIIRGGEVEIVEGRKS